MRIVCKKDFKSFTDRLVIGFLCLSHVTTLFIAQAAWAQDTLTYTIGFPNAVHHEASISLQIKDLPHSSLTAHMSNTSPGRYAIHQFAKNVYDINARGQNPDSHLMMSRTEPDVWKISNIDSELNLTYTVYGNYGNGTYNAITEDYAILNMPATIMWIEELADKPIKVVFDLPDTATWKIATQLQLLDSVGKVYFAPNLDYLMDSPVLAGNIMHAQVDIRQSDSRIRLAALTNGSPEPLALLADITGKLIAEQTAVFGNLPVFDFGEYTFLCSYLPSMKDDGMEHRNSTLITSPILLAGNEEQLSGTIAHEFFHAWNMERIRPASLEPFDYKKPVVCRELWFGEGFTSYYEDLTRCRAGIIDRTRYVADLGRTINFIINSPGWQFGSPVYMSEIATYTDDAAFTDETNQINTNLSYYPYGMLVALALDLRLRSEFRSLSLDDLMRQMWSVYGKTGRTYTNSDIQQELATLTKNAQFASSFFENHVYGNKIPDLESIFDKAGYRFIHKNPGKPTLGFLRLRFDGDTATIMTHTLYNTPLYEAKLKKGDRILSLDGQPVTDYAELEFIIGTRRVGDIIKVQFLRNGKIQTSSIKLEEDNQYVLIPKENFSIKLKDEELKIRNEWLGSKSASH